MPKFISLYCIDDNFNQTILKIYFTIVKKTLKKRIATIFSIYIFIIFIICRLFVPLKAPFGVSTFQKNKPKVVEGR